MALPTYWDEFITDYASNGIYWFFPKGGTADTEELRKKFAVFASFEGRLWDGNLQRNFLAALRAENLTNAQSQAYSRMLKRVFENLGLCWVVSDQPIRILESGKNYLAETGASATLNSHIWRYQLPNKLNPASNGVSLTPHLVAVEILLSCDNKITDQEYALFVSRLQHEHQIADAIERIKAWRAVSPSIKTEVIARLHASTRWATIEENSGYFLAFHRCDWLLDRNTDRLSVSDENVEELRLTLELYKGETVQIEFKDASDTAVFYSDPSRVPTRLEALDYYIDVSDVEKAVEVYKTLPPEIRGPLTDDEFERNQFLEKDLEQFLETRLHLIEEGLEWLGRQYSTAAGPIDLYARASNGDLVVIELKKDRAADKVFGQICRYIGCIKVDHAAEGEKVRGFIIGREIDQKLRYAQQAVQPGLVALQVYEFTGEEGKDDWISVKAA